MIKQTPKAIFSCSPDVSIPIPSMRPVKFYINCTITVFFSINKEYLVTPENKHGNVLEIVKDSHNIFELNSGKKLLTLK
jgi:hypothetical protein